MKARGNPQVGTPSRGSYPQPVVLRHAGVRNWDTFEKKARLWILKWSDEVAALVPTTLVMDKGYVELPDQQQQFVPSQTESLAAALMEQL